MPSLDAGTPSVFKKINRPAAKGVSFKKIVAGLKKLRKEFAGRIWLEIMLIKNYNDTPRQAKHIREIIREIRPDKVIINLPVRPSANAVTLPSYKKINMFQAIIGEGTDVAVSFTPRPQKHLAGKLRDLIIKFLKRRPATAQELAVATGHNISEILKVCTELCQEGKMKNRLRKQRNFYILNR